MKLDDPKVVDLLGDSLASTLTSVFGQIEIAEQEIVAARGGKTEPDDDDPLWRAFMLLRATDDLMVTEYVYRAHVREILARVAAGQPTAPATDTELVCAISRASQVAPAHREARTRSPSRCAATLGARRRPSRDGTARRGSGSPSCVR